MEITQAEVEAEKAKLAGEVEDAKRNLTPEQRNAVEAREMELRYMKCEAEIGAVCKKYGFVLRIGPPTVHLVPTTP